MAEGLALVTGASSGIGFELAKLFADDGYDLIVASDEDRIDACADELREAGVDVRAMMVDLRNSEDVVRLHETATADGRTLAAVALNAGIGRAGPFVEGDQNADLGVIDLNVLARMPKDDPARVARRGYDAMMSGERKVLAASLFSRAMGITTWFLPDSVKSAANRLIVTRTGKR